MEIDKANLLCLAKCSLTCTPSSSHSPWGTCLSSLNISADIIICMYKCTDVCCKLKEEVKQRPKENGGHQKSHLLVSDWALSHLASAFIPCDVSRKDLHWHFLIRIYCTMYIRHYKQFCVLAFIYNTASNSGRYLALRDAFSREISDAVQSSIHSWRLCQGVQGWVVTRKVFAAACDRRHRFWRPTRKVLKLGLVGSSVAVFENFSNCLIWLSEFLRIKW